MTAAGVTSIERRATGERRFRNQWLSTIGGFARHQPLGAFSAVLLLLVVIAAVFAGQIAPYAPNVNHPSDTLLGPRASHLSGTDQFGRDVFSRVIFGARVSLLIGVTATLVIAVCAAFLGTISAYFGGVVDHTVQRIVDVVQSIPGLILLLLIISIFGRSTFNVILALSFGGIWQTSRVIRAQVLAVLANPYIESARVIGCRNVRIMLLHVLPNIVPTIIVIASIAIGGVIVAEASLSFLGLGVAPPTATWGSMMSAEGRSYMIVAPWILIAPTIALSVVVYAFNMFGDSMRDRLDPRLRGSR